MKPILSLVEKKHLLPCPFCGSADIKIPIELDAYISCTNCLSFGPSPIVANLEHDKNYMTNIISLWNTRHGK